MKEIKLTDRELFTIKDRAHKIFINEKCSTDRNRAFLTECVVNATLEYFKRCGYTVKDGKIFKK